MTTFQEVFEGTADSLRIAIAVGSTRATREDINVAVWELKREQLLPILDDIAKKENDFNQSRWKQNKNTVNYPRAEDPWASSPTGFNK